VPTAPFSDPTALGVAGLLREFRSRARLTQEALAQAAGLSAQAIGALEGGRRRYPRMTTIDLLAKALDLSEADRRRFEQAARRTGNGPAHPQQLPPPITDFTGRTRELGELLKLLRSPYDVAPGVVISAIGGMGGVGKTALAVQAAHLVSEEYPDGRLYLDLRAGGGDPLRPADAIAHLLRALGVPVSGDPEDVELAAARYRTALAGRRVLVLLDDATSVAQVTPLIPGTAGSTVVITSRRRLSALPGVRRLGLEPLGADEALQLLGEIVGHDEIRATPEAALAVVQECGLLPLAIRIAGGQAAGNLPALAERLADDNSRLDVLTDPGRGVRTSISVSIRALTTSDNPADAVAAGSFPMLSLFGGDHFSLRVAAKVLDLPLDDTEDLLDRLIDIHLLETPALHQYRMHDLVREIGREIATADLSAEQRAEAHDRELRCYLAMVWRYHQLTSRGAFLGDQLWAVGAEDVTTADFALAWLDAEVPNLVRLIQAAGSSAAEERLIAARTALGMVRLAAARLRFGEVHDALLAANGFVADRSTVLACGLLVGLAQLCEALGQFGRAVGYLQEALPVARMHGDLSQLMTCLIELGYALGHAGRPAEGLPHAEEALDIGARIDAAGLIDGATVSLGVLAGMTGDVGRQRSAFDRVLERLAGLQNPKAAPVFLSMMGESLRSNGQFEAALPVLLDGLDSARRIGAETVAVDLLLQLGALRREQGDHARALDLLEEALGIAIRHPAENREGPVRRELGQVYADLGQPEEARGQWERAIVCFERVADPAATDVRALLRGSEASA
jgi:tetratricopeptide (TPR) repeat protein/transcriptional regulator with XRE-family HTH domain